MLIGPLGGVGFRLPPREDGCIGSRPPRPPIIVIDPPGPLGAAVQTDPASCSAFPSPAEPYGLEISVSVTKAEAAPPAFPPGLPPPPAAAAGAESVRRSDFA
jgi:hypothetical protein